MFVGLYLFTKRLNKGYALEFKFLNVIYSIKFRRLKLIGA